MLNMAYDYAKNFNPRTPAKECDDQSVQHRSPSFYFNPRTPAKECDIPDSMEIHCVDRFQSTHPREGVRRFCLSITTIISYFNPRTPAKECDGLAVTLGLFCWNFNPRTPAKECDLASFQSFSLPSRISIHAPPRRSATTLTHVLKLRAIYFNPRTPAKECDLTTYLTTYLLGYFNPRTPAKECDTSVKIATHSPQSFQSTHPREGVRPGDGRHGSIRTVYFNPRTPAKECDVYAAAVTGKADPDFNPRTPAKECDDDILGDEDY